METGDEECVRNKIQIVPPDVNRSKNKNRVTKDGIILGYSMISGVSSFGEIIERDRIEHGRYADLSDFIKRVHPNDVVFRNLALSGAFDCFGVDRVKVADNCKRIIQSAKSNSIISALSENTSKTDIRSIIKNEVDSIGFPITINSDLIDGLSQNKQISSISDLTTGHYTICGAVYALDIYKKIGNGAEYAKVKLYDGTGVLECRVSSKYYPKLKERIIKGKIVNVSGDYSYDVDRGIYSFWVSDIT